MLFIYYFKNVTLNMEFENEHSKFHIRSVVKKKLNDHTGF